MEEGGVRKRVSSVAGLYPELEDREGDAREAEGRQVDGKEAEVVQKYVEDVASEDEIHEENGRILEAMGGWTEGQVRRYEAFRRCSLGKAKVRRLMGDVAGPRAEVSDTMAVVVSGVTKLLLGRMVETARRLAEAQGHTGPLLPAHYVQARRVLESRGDWMPVVHHPEGRDEEARPPRRHRGVPGLHL